jgi:tetratricopeptide (TPR) repeat protein
MTLIGLAVSLVLVTIGVGIFVFRLNGGRNTANTPIPSTEEPILIPIATETTTSVFPPEQQKPTEHIAPPATAVSTVSHSDTAVPEIPTPTSMATPDIQNLTGEQKKQLAEALVSAFPEYSKLKQMVSYRMEENLDVIVGKGPLSDVAFDLVEWAISQGEIGELIQAACQENPGNPDLQDFTEQMNIACPLPSNQGSEGPSSTSPMTGTFNILIEHSGDMNDAPQGFAAFIGDNLDSILNNSSEIVIQMDKLPQKRTLMSDLCESSVDVRVVIEQLKDESWDLTFYICDFLQEGIEVTKHFNQKPVAGENFTDKRTCMNELTDVVVLFLAGLKYLFNNEFVQASNFFADAIRKVEDPDYCIGESDTEQILDTLYLFHGRSLSASQQRELALQSYSQTLRLNPDYAWAYICIGNIYATQATEQDLVDYRKSKALQVNALENYVTALDICEKDHSDNCHPNAYIPGKTYINIGNVYNHWTSWPVLNEADARKYFEDAHVAYACALHFYGEDYECYDERLFSQNAKDTVPGRYIAHVYYAEGLLLEEEALRFSSEAKQKKKQALEMYQQCQKVLEGEDALSRDLQQLCQERIDKLSDIALFPTVL